MKKIILLSLFAFMSFGFHQVEALSLVYGYYFDFYPEKTDASIYYQKYEKNKLAEVCPNAIKLGEVLGDKTITFFPKVDVYYPMHCYPNGREGKYSIDSCRWKVGDYTDDGILLYAPKSFEGIKQGTRIFIYTDNIDFVTDDCFYDEYIYEQTKNFKYTSVIGRSIVVKAYRKTDYKYKDVTKTLSELMDAPPYTGRN